MWVTFPWLRIWLRIACQARGLEVIVYHHRRNPAHTFEEEAGDVRRGGKGRYGGFSFDKFDDMLMVIFDATIVSNFFS